VSARAGIVFTTIGIVTSDPASVESVLTWGARLQTRAAYLIVENSVTEHAEFTYWRESDRAQQFQKVFRPAVMARYLALIHERPKCFVFPG